VPERTEYADKGKIVFPLAGGWGVVPIGLVQKRGKGSRLGTHRGSP